MKGESWKFNKVSESFLFMVFVGIYRKKVLGRWIIFILVS